MPQLQDNQVQQPQQLLREILAAKNRAAWESIAQVVHRVPAPLQPEWLPVADEIAFALGQLQRAREAIALLETTYQAEPTWRRASALAYLHYDASMRLLRPGTQVEGFDKETLRKGFRRWIAQALELWPESIKDLYRLGIFEAQVESRHDAAALRALLQAIDLYRNAGAQPYGGLRRTYARALYAAGRSALRLHQIKLARKLSFACVREDQDTDHVDPVHKLHLAARVCLAGGELDHAERAARLALDAKGPPRRDYLFGLLSDIALGRGDAKGAAAWVEQHVPVHRRDSSLWRRLGDARRAAGDTEGACQAYDSSLLRDRCGRHLTLVRLGEIHLANSRIGRAEDAFRKALEFRRSRYMTDDVQALTGLEKVLAVRGQPEELDRVRARLAKARCVDPYGAAEPDPNDDLEAIA